MTQTKEADKKFRVIGASVNKTVANLPVELPNMVKILFRNDQWTPIGDGKLKTKDEAQKDFRQFGILATKPQVKNQTALDIEEVFV